MRRPAAFTLAASRLHADSDETKQIAEGDGTERPRTAGFFAAGMIAAYGNLMAGAGISLWMKQVAR